MAVNHYESVVIINASLEDEQIEQSVESVLEAITTNGGDVLDVDKWGRRRLAYPIQKSKTGYYLVINYTAPSDLIAKFERALKLDETVIRYLTVALDKKDLERISLQKEYDKKKAEAAAEAKALEEEAEKAAAAEKAESGEDIESSDETDNSTIEENE